jgi:TRAP-type C4-dicarboxylate transport system permease small subunit
VNQTTLLASGIAGLALLVMTLIITMDVVLRYAFTPTKWVQEFSTYLMVVLIFLGLAYALKEDAHIKVDFLVVRLPRRIQDWMQVIHSTLFLVFTIIIFYFNWHLFNQSFALKSTSYTSVDVIIWPAQLFMPLGLAIMGLLLICNIYAEAKAVLGKPKEGK